MNRKVVECTVSNTSRGKASTTYRALFALFLCVPFFSASAAQRLGANFEKEKVTASKKESYDNIQMTLPTGQSANIGILYEGGDEGDRIARIAPDPTNKDNHALQYWLKHAEVKGQRSGHYKGRIQMNLADINMTEAYQRYRIYLHPDLSAYRSYPEQNTWFTINELWFGANWKKAAYPFRISLNIGKEKGVGKPLRFLASGAINDDGKWKDVWTEVNQDFEVPVGEWLDMEVGYKQGNKNSGRFYVAVKRAGDSAAITILDVHNWTYNPESPSPVPMTHWNPLKVYTSSAIIDHVRESGGVVQIYWDDLEILDSWPHQAASK